MWIQRISCFLGVCLTTGVVGCDMTVRAEDGFVSVASLGELGYVLANATDMAGDLSSPPSCVAAKGVSGNNLLCADFTSTTLANLTSQGWDFTNAGGCPGWEVQNGKLQIKNFGMFMSSCGFLMKALPPAEYEKYTSFTLVLTHRVDVNDPQQKVQIMLGLDDPASRLLDQRTGKQPRQQSAYTVHKTDLPVAARSSFQPLFKITSGAIVGTLHQGWQIESIAVQGNL